MNVLYVTTFNKEIFRASGKAMVESFIDTQINRKILCCSEGFNYDEKFKKNNITSIDIAESKLLKSWLYENKKYIPSKYGGKADPKYNPEVFLPWNFRAAGWFRKIVAMNQALTMSNDFDVIIFVDSDSKFKKYISDELITKAFDGKSCFYHWGEQRKQKDLAVESGFIGFLMDHAGKDILDTWISKYNNGEFRRYMRWDDGGMMSNVLLERNFKNSNDLVTNYADNGKSKSHVIERGLFADYINHDKGLHKKIGLV